MKFTPIIFISLFALLCQAAQANIDENSAKKQIRLMSYNVENLFDAQHDEGKDDWTFLPKGTPGKNEACEMQPNSFYKEECLTTDWTEERFQIKLQQIKTVVLKTGADLPDMLALVEIENENVAKKLADLIGYKRVLITNSLDQRGIDVALLFNENANLQFVKEFYHRVDVTDAGGHPTRDVLEVQFNVGKEKLAVFVNHWPSQAAPVQARTKLAEMVAERSKVLQASGFKVVLAGDFNVDPTNDQPLPFLAFGDPTKNPQLIDIDKKYRDTKLNVSDMPIGTYFYGTIGYENAAPNMKWNVLDHFFVSPDLLLDGSGLKVVLSSYRIFSFPESESKYYYGKGPYAGTVIQRVPKRYNHNASSAETSGFSDHFPILLDFTLN